MVQFYVGQKWRNLKALADYITICTTIRYGINNCEHLMFHVKHDDNEFSSTVLPLGEGAAKPGIEMARRDIMQQKWEE